jgi:hypothetical protein
LRPRSPPGCRYATATSTPCALCFLPTIGAYIWTNRRPKTFPIFYPCGIKSVPAIANDCVGCGVSGQPCPLHGSLTARSGAFRITLPIRPAFLCLQSAKQRSSISYFRCFLINSTWQSRTPGWKIELRISCVVDAPGAYAHDDMICYSLRYI